MWVWRYFWRVIESWSGTEYSNYFVCYQLPPSMVIVRFELLNLILTCLFHIITLFYYVTFSKPAIFFFFICFPIHKHFLYFHFTLFQDKSQESYIYLYYKTTITNIPYLQNFVAIVKNCKWENGKKDNMLYSINKESLSTFLLEFPLGRI